MKGKLIVIEGTDFSGKTTQHNKVVGRMKAEGYDIGVASFPVYEDEGSVFVRRYLEGVYGEEVESVSAKQASYFYGLDRYDSYKRSEWGRKYKEGGLLIFARYTTSNMVHQASKIESKEGRLKYIEWLKQFEYKDLGLPEPDKVIFLDMPPEVRVKLKEKRDKEQGGLASSGTEKDIHEKDKEYLDRSYRVAKEVAKEEGWVVISCVDEDGVLKTIEAIHKEIYREVRETLGE